MTKKDLELSVNLAWEAAYARQPEWAIDVLHGLAGDAHRDAVLWNHLTPRELRAVRFSCYLTLYN